MKQKSLIEAHNNTIKRLSDISQTRRASDLDFLTRSSINYRDAQFSPSSANENEDEKLTIKVKDAFIEEAERVGGVIDAQTRLNSQLPNLSNPEIKTLNRYTNDYFKRLKQIGEVGGYLSVATEELQPDNLPNFMADWPNYNINGYNERDRDNNLFQASGWANDFDYYDDVKVKKDFYFQPTAGGEKTVLTQDIYIDPLGKTFKDFLHNKPYIIDDFLANKNLEQDETGKHWYKISGEVDSDSVVNLNILDHFISDVPAGMKLGDAFENAELTKNGTLQPQYFLGGSPISSDNETPEEDTAVKMPMYTVKENKMGRNLIKFINTEAINANPAYNSEVNAHMAGVFANGGGNPGVLYGYANNRLGIDLPIGFFDYITPEEKALYESLSPEEKTGYMGLREKFNTLNKTNKRNIGLVNAQKAWFLQRTFENNLDRKLPQQVGDNEPSIVKDILTDKTEQGKDMIEFLNKNNMPIPEFYRIMLGIQEWQAGMPVFYQKLPEELKNLPKKPSPKQKEFIKKYS
tara:strand:- start:10 stop:1566 length:1557 start_codon:yes stop_codon:yes gene_type:complete